jgi:ATP-dependent Clp protease ATP-binding subunit ClpX
VVGPYHDLSEDDLARILIEPKNSIIKQYKKLFAMEGIDLVFTDEAINKIANMAKKKYRGARSLRTIIENIMLDLMYDIPDREGVVECIVGKEVIENTAEPILKTA